MLKLTKQIKRISICLIRLCKLYYFLKVVSFYREIKQNDHVLERTDLPNNLIKYVSGTVLFAQELPRVCMKVTAVLNTE